MISLFLSNVYGSCKNLNLAFSCNKKICLFINIKYYILNFNNQFGIKYV